MAGCGKENNGGPEDNTSPGISKTQPVNGATEVPLNTEIMITYNEIITLGNAYQITVNYQKVTASVIDSLLYIDYQLEENMDYIVIVSGISVLDLAKNYGPAYTFSFSTKKEITTEIKENLAVQNPSPEAVNLYNFLKQNYGEKIISATMANVNWNINEAEWVEQHTGKYPAIATFDYVHLQYSPANWIDYSNTGIIEDWWNNHGIISAGWHWNVPVSEGSEELDFYSVNNLFKASNVTVDGTWEKETADNDLEKIAGYLKLLQEKNIPVLWRPLHEAAGNVFEYSGGNAWFWWGADGAQAYKDLWIYMFDYFHDQGLNNLIWVWTTQTKDDPFYPGDEYVDIIGRDIYNNDDTEAISMEFNSIQAKYPNKIITLSEMGSVANISAQWSSGAKWSYFMPWYDYERTINTSGTEFQDTSHDFADADWWIDALDSPYVVTRDEMPSLK